MPEPDAKRPRRRRRWLIALIALLSMLVACALVLRHYLQTDQLTTLLVGKTHDLFGAELSLDGAARYEFMPTLHLVLPRPALKASGTGAMLLRADSLEVAMPWHTLWADRYDIDRINLVKPVLDLDALRAWLAARAPSNTPPPDVRFALHVDDGTIVRAGTPIAQGVKLDFASAGDVAAWLDRIQRQPAGATLLPPLTGSASATTIQIGDTRIDGVQLDVRDDATATPARQP